MLHVQFLHHALIVQTEHPSDSVMSGRQIRSDFIVSQKFDNQAKD